MSEDVLAVVLGSIGALALIVVAGLSLLAARRRNNRIVAEQGGPSPHARRNQVVALVCLAAVWILAAFVFAK